MTSTTPSDTLRSTASGATGAPEAAGSEAAARLRIADLERRLGDPWDEANPLGHTAVLAADERAEVLPEAERILDEFGLNAEFVPTGLGGRMERADVLARVLRPVFRRDPSLGFGYGATSYLAASAVWAGGTPEQQRSTAERLLGGGRLAVAYRDLAHGNAFLRDEFTARRHEGGFLVDGEKKVISNADRAEGLVLFCRTGEAQGGQSHSALLLDRTELPPERVRDLPRHQTLGLRGCRMGGLGLTDCAVPEGALLGRWGGGVELALSSFQLTRSVLPSMVLAGADTLLRTTTRFAVERGVRGRPGVLNPLARASLVGAFLDLLICDSLALTSTRAAHLYPEATQVYASATKYLLPIVLTDTSYDLSVLLGSNVYLRDGEFGIFQKHVRDLPVTSLGHSGAAACQSTIIPQLPGLAARWFAGPAPEATLFRPGDGLPPLDHDRLRPVAAAYDPLAAELVAAGGEPWPDGPAGEYGELLRTLVSDLTEHLAELQDACRSLSLQGRSVANPRSYALVDRYTLMLAVASCLGVWRHGTGGSDDFLADPVWLLAALFRLGRRLGLNLPQQPKGLEEPVFQELLARYHDGSSLDLYRTPAAR